MIVYAVAGKIQGDKWTSDISRGVCGSIAEHFRCCGILPGRRRELNEEVVLVQYLVPEHPVPFTDQLKQLVELHRVAELAMKDLIIRLWPAEAIPSSYFGLVKRLVDACPRLDAVKRSVCIEGARLAFSYVKVWWAKMDVVKLATEGPPEGKEHHTPE